MTQLQEKSISDGVFSESGQAAVLTVLSMMC